MQNLKLWHAILVVAVILSLMLLVPQGNYRFAVFGIAVLAAVVMYLASHRKP